VANVAEFCARCGNFFPHDQVCSKCATGRRERRIIIGLAALAVVAFAAAGIGWWLILNRGCLL
jgi:recombinational DNA repair protein RecR